jgi:quinol monooxygenase YgiN
MFVARIALKIQDPQRDAFRRYAAAEGLAPRTLAGCVEYSFCENVSDPTRVLLYEEWASRDAFESYKASPMFAAVGARLQPMLAAAPKSAYYESENIFDTCAVQ